MKNVTRIALFFVISFLALVDVSANCEFYNGISRDTLTVSDEELLAVSEPESEVEPWMIEPFVLRRGIREDQIVDFESEIEVEPWMIIPFAPMAGEYASQDKTAEQDVELSITSCYFCTQKSL